MIVYVYPKCSTCQKALRFLESRLDKSEFIVKDIVATPPSIAELKILLKVQNGNIKKLFNTSGQLYRELGLSDKLQTLSEHEALKILSENGMLVKRPFLLGKDIGLLGFKESIWEATILKGPWGH